MHYRKWGNSSSMNPRNFVVFLIFFLFFSSENSLCMQTTYILLTVTWFFSFSQVQKKILSRSHYFMNEKWNERLVLQHETCYDGGGWWSVCITWSFWLSHWSRSPTILRALFHSRFFLTTTLDTVFLLLLLSCTICDKEIYCNEIVRIGIAKKFNLSAFFN